MAGIEPALSLMALWMHGDYVPPEHLGLATTLPIVIFHKVIIQAGWT